MAGLRGRKKHCGPSSPAISQKKMSVSCIDRFCSRASRSGLKPFVTVAKTIRKRKEGILAAVRLGINNAQHEGLNRRVRLIVNRAYGFHTANAARSPSSCSPSDPSPTFSRTNDKPTIPEVTHIHAGSPTNCRTWSGRCPGQKACIAHVAPIRRRSSDDTPGCAAKATSNPSREPRMRRTRPRISATCSSSNSIG